MLPFFDQDHFALQARAREWVAKQLVPTTPHDASTDERAARIVQDLGVEGFLKHTVAEPFGGIRPSVQARDLCILREELARGDALADTMFAMQALGSYPISLAGSDAQRHCYLPRVAEGAAIAAFAITEPEAGSDVAAMQTRAVRRGDRVSLSGTKSFISNAGLADFYIVFALAESTNSSSVNAWIVDASASGIASKKIALLSPHPIGAVEFTDCVVGEHELLRNEGEGLKIAFATLDLLRCTAGAAAVGLGQRALDEALQYGKNRRQFGRSIAEFQGIQFKLAEMATDLAAARLLVYQAAWVHDRSEGEAKVQSSMAKLHATEAAQRIVDQALQIHGGNGLIAGTIMERLYRDVRALRIYEGTSEIQKLIIARELLKKS